MTATLTESPDTVNNDAIAMLKADHKAMGKMFVRYDETRSFADKKALVNEICTALSVHAQIAEEIFYPEVKTLNDKPGAPQATVERRDVQHLIARLQGVEADAALYDAKVRVLADYVTHHIGDAHDAMCQQVKASSLDMIDIGARMAARRDDLLARAASPARKCSKGRLVVVERSTPNLFVVVQTVPGTDATMPLQVLRTSCGAR